MFGPANTASMQSKSPPASAGQPTSRGFALVVTLTLMILLSIIAVGLLTLSSISLRASAQGQARATACANARMAMMIALGELQKAAGPDQRVTATASILGDSSNRYSSSVTAVDGRRHWTGVWKSDVVAEPGSTPSYSPKRPDEREFVGWLVSSPDAASKTPEERLEEVGSVPGDSDVTIFKGASAADDVVVPKVTVSEGGVTTGSYAYWVEDQSVKADLGWSEGSFASDERKQAARLEAAPGPDYEVFGGPFTSATVSHPVTMDAGNSWLGDMDKAVSPAEMGLIIGDSSNQSEWLKERRHDITLGSLGVMADVKFGGLRRDLSLAFEMDGDDDVDSEGELSSDNDGAVLGKFNAQDGEFVGGNDRLTAGQVAEGMPLKARHPYRDVKGSGSTFSDDILAKEINKYTGGGIAQISLRGPTWWLLRDYANLYKRLQGSAGGYALKARSYYPNISQDAMFSNKLSTATGRGSIWDSEEDFSANPDPEIVDTNKPYIFRPARASYAPVSLGASTIVSLRGSGETNLDLAVVVDMFLFFWNPYNHDITCDNLVVGMDAGIPGKVRLKITPESGSSRTVTKTLHELLKTKLLSRSGERLSFLTKDETGGAITLKPGEVVAATLSDVQGEANLGFNFSTTSGLVVNGINWGGAIKSTDDIGYVFQKTLQSDFGAAGSARRSEVQLFLPDRSLVPEDLRTFGNFGEELQLLHFTHYSALNVDVGTPDYQEFVSPAAYANNPVKTVGMNTLVDSKRVIGVISALMKPAEWAGRNPNPVEVFSRFNPTPIAIVRDYNRICGPNQIYNHITGPEPAELLQSHGISYSGSPRGAFWGLSFNDNGTSTFPVSSIPTSPLISLASLGHANASVMANEPFHAIGNSWSQPLVPVDTTFGGVRDVNGNIGNITAHDLSWQMNNALFDRYYFSGIAPAFSINGSGYNTDETLTEPLERFYGVSGSDYKTANANPVLVPHVPAGKSAQDVVEELDEEDGYLKTGAYSLIEGAFNVNSTSEEAWEAFLRSNKDLDIDYSDGGKETSSGVPFPSSATPANGAGADKYWSGFSRLDDIQIRTLAKEIVEQVRLRGPFMSISDFVNRRVGEPVSDETHYVGALQAAIDAADINGSVQAAAGGVDPMYKTDHAITMFSESQGVGKRTSATGIPGEINQAELLLPLAPRLTARSDTFKIRAYGEARAKDGTITAKAVCEMIVQRLPEYMDPTTDPDNNEPWDEAMDPITPSASSLNAMNHTLGRRMKVLGFRWLSLDEI